MEPAGDAVVGDFNWSAKETEWRQTIGDEETKFVLPDDFAGWRLHPTYAGEGDAARLAIAPTSSGAEEELGVHDENGLGLGETLHNGVHPRGRRDTGGGLLVARHPRHDPLGPPPNDDEVVVVIFATRSRRRHGGTTRWTSQTAWLAAARSHTDNVTANTHDKSRKVGEWSYVAATRPARARVARAAREEGEEGTSLPPGGGPQAAASGSECLGTLGWRVLATAAARLQAGARAARDRAGAWGPCAGAHKTLAARLGRPGRSGGWVEWLAGGSRKRPT